MGLLDLYESTREVMSEYKQQSGAIDSGLAAELAASYTKAFEEQHASRRRELEADAEYARKLSARDDIEVIESMRQCKDDEELARRLQSEYEQPASPPRPAPSGWRPPPRPAPSAPRQRLEARPPPRPARSARQAPQLSGRRPPPRPARSAPPQGLELRPPPRPAPSGRRQRRRGHSVPRRPPPPSGRRR